MLDDVILCLHLHVRLLSTYDVVFIRSDIPTMLIPMISLVIWDVMHGGMARAHDGLMMLLTVGRSRALRLIMFSDGWLSFTMIFISLLMDGCIMYVISFIYFNVLVS